MSGTIHVACASSHVYLPHGAAMLHSVLAHGGSREVHVHFLHSPSFPPAAREPLCDMVEQGGGRISFVEVPSEVSCEVGLLPGDEPITWYRVFLADLLPELGRVLYLDVDTITVDSLDPLWTIDLEGHCVGAVTNVLPAEHSNHPQTLGLASADGYLNSGVLLFDLEEMRRSGAADELKAYAWRKGGRVMWGDQDVLSVVLEQRRLPIHPRWNCMNALFLFPWSVEVFPAAELEEARRRPGIRHFEGPPRSKPWHYLFPFEGGGLYWAHRRQTPWARGRPDGLTPVNVARRVARGVLRRGAPVA